MASAFGGQRPEVSLPNVRSLLNDKILILLIYEIIAISIGFPELLLACYPGVTPTLRSTGSDAMEGLPDGAKSHYEAHD